MHKPTTTEQDIQAMHRKARKCLSVAPLYDRNNPLAPYDPAFDVPQHGAVKYMKGYSYRRANGGLELVRDDREEVRVDKARTDHDDVLERLKRLQTHVKKTREEVTELKHGCERVIKAGYDAMDAVGEVARKNYEIFFEEPCPWANKKPEEVKKPVKNVTIVRPGAGERKAPKKPSEFPLAGRKQKILPRSASR